MVNLWSRGSRVFASPSEDEKTIDFPLLVTNAPYISLLLPYLLFLLCLVIIILYESYCITDNTGKTNTKHIKTKDIHWI